VKVHTASILSPDDGYSLFLQNVGIDLRRDYLEDQRYYSLLKLDGSRVSSVSIVSDYGLDDRAIEVRSSAEAKGFFL
jgi:hypothetical protein